MDYFSIINILLAPSLWWVWELVVTVMFITNRIFSRLNKTEAFRMQNRNGNWYHVGTKYISRTGEFFHAKKDETHTIENDLSPWVDESGIGAKPVLFYKLEKSRPVKVQIGLEEIPHDPKNKTNPGVNPSSKALYRLIKGEEMRQMQIANATMAHPQLIISLVLVLVGFMAGIILGPTLQSAIAPSAQVGK